MTTPGPPGAPYTVLHVAQPVDGGVGRVVAEAVRDQLARGWRVVVACPEGPLAADARAAGASWRHWRATRSPGWRTLPEAVRLRRLVRGIEPDVVHLHSAKAGLAGRLAVHGRTRTLFQPHGWSWLAVRGATTRIVLAWERFGTRWTDLVICVGEGEAELARRRGIAAPLVVIRNGVDLSTVTEADEPARARCRAELGLPVDSPLVVCLGRVTRQKGQDKLLGAWPGVRLRCPDAELILVGDGDLRSRLIRSGLAGVRFVPRVIDPLPWFTAADVVVPPSRWEGLALTLLEALAVGRSIVVTDIPGLREPLQDLPAARVPLGDAAALAAAITNRLRDRDLRQGEERTARHRVADFDLRRTLDRLATVTVGTQPVEFR